MCASLSLPPSYVRLINQPGKDRKQVVASRMDAISADIGHGIESGDILDLMSTLADDKRQRVRGAVAGLRVVVRCGVVLWC